MNWRNNFVWYPYFENQTPLDKPPVLLSIIDDYVNYGKEERTKILDLSEAGRELVFDFDYPLSEYVDKDTFERTFIDHFLQRRIGAETFTAFKLHLRAKLNTIMPYYNLLFDAMGEKFDILSGGSFKDIYLEASEGTHAGTEREDTHEVNKGKDTEKSKNTVEDERREEKIGTSNTSMHTVTDGETDRRYSDTPQNEISNVKNGAYVTDYTFQQDDNTVDSTGSGRSTDKKHNRADVVTSDDRELNSTDTKDGNRKKTSTGVDSGSKNYTLTHDALAAAETILKFKESSLKIYEMIFTDCDTLFYQLF